MSLKKAVFYPYDQVPVSDSTWSVHTGPDRRIYAACCTEHRGGVAAIIARYDGDRDGLEYLVDVGEAGGDPADSGRPTQCKIHYGFVPSERDGILYAATHASAPALGGLYININSDWGDDVASFRGSVLLAYDTRADRVLWSRLFIPREGCRCLCLDDERRLMYAVGWPRNHFLVYDLETGDLTSQGRIGSINPQAIWLDAKGRAHTTDDYGRILRYDPDRGRLEELDCFVPHSPKVSGWHSVIYDVVALPDGESLVGVPWTNEPRLFRHWPLDGPHGRIEDLGPDRPHLSGWRHPVSFGLDHVGGLVVGPDAEVYYVATRPSGPASEMVASGGLHAAEGFVGVVVRLDPDTGEREDVALLEGSDGRCRSYVSRGAMDRKGDLFFGNVAVTPSGVFRLDMGRREPVEPALRMWG